MTKKVAVVFAASLVFAGIGFALLRGGIGQHERERSETKHATEAQAGSSYSEFHGHDEEKTHPSDEEQCRMRKDERGLPYVPIYDEKGHVENCVSPREYSVVQCRRRKDKFGRPYVPLIDEKGLLEYCASQEELQELESLPVWAIRGKKVWADDWTPCPIRVAARRCDAIGFDPERKKQACLLFEGGLAHHVDIIEDPDTGDFIAFGVGEGPAIFGIGSVGGVGFHDQPPYMVTFDREGTFVEDVFTEDFVLVECLPSGEIDFELIDSEGKPLDDKLWGVAVVNSCPVGDICPLAYAGEHGIWRALADRDIEVRFDIEGMPPQYRTVRAVKGKITHMVVQIDTSDPTGIEGYVWDADSLQPLSGASVDIVPEWVLPGLWSISTVTDENGFYSFKGVTPGVPFRVSAWAFEYEGTKYVGKELRKWERLRLDFPMKRFGKEVSVDPEVEIVNFLPDFRGCEDPSLYSSYKDKIESALNSAVHVLVDKCPGRGTVHAARVSEWYSKHPKQQVCIYCFDNRIGGVAWPYMEFKYEDLKFEPNFAIILSCNLVSKGSDHELASTLFHELIHFGEAELEELIRRKEDAKKKGTPPDPQSEINAYACEYTCMGGESYPGGVPSEDLKKCIPPEVEGGGGGGGGGWDWMFNNDKFFNSCPTPSNPTRCAEVRPRSDGSPHCEICCPAPNCNPNMKCWMDFAPKSPKGQCELPQAKNKICKSLGVSGAERRGARPCEIEARICKNRCASHRCEGSSTHSLGLQGDKVGVSSLPPRPSSISLEAGTLLQRQIGSGLQISKHDARIRSVGSILPRIKFFLPEMRVRALQWLREHMGGASCGEHCEPK